ncbi:putative ferric-chelate reductase 1-like protein [Hypsibius exemplaris]|uniref:Ferric-chelate reductase 1-like protein n=1 Tax=Hypsibius exemplaris TaxID=2072580 RepID=A0A9X6NLQ7_HYPEX|nr:putative ferric-chelate reductase 1-like protein [Hypsibius exemplaris]
MGHRPIRQLMDDDDITVHETALDFPYIYCRFSHKARVINKRTGFQLPVESLAFLISVRGPVRSGEISKHSGRPTITYTPISLHFTPPVNDDLYTLHAGAYDIDLNESDTSNPSPKTLLSSSSLSEVQLASNTTATPDLSFVSMAVNSMSIFLPVFNPAITSFTGALLPSNISEAVNGSAFFEFTMEGDFVPILENGTDGTGTNEYGTDGTGTKENGTDGTGTNEIGTNGTGTNEIGTNGTGTNDNGTDGTETNKIGTNGTGTNETGKHENGTNGTDLFASFDLDPMTVVLDDADSYLGKITAGCGWEKGCMGHPDRCLNQTDPCHAVSTWRPSAHNRDEYIIELWRRADPKSREGKFVAIGFNAKSGQMAKTGVIACVDAQNTVDVLASYNPSYYSTAVDNPKEGITVLQTGADGTHLYCQFSVQSNKSFRGSFAGSPANVDLNNPLYMVLAYGPATPNGVLRKHSTAPLVSSGQVRLTDVAVSGAANKDYYKAHAGLMVGAWMFLASVGIFTARYYKPMWPGTKPCGLPVWFHIHRPIMILAISAAIAAFVLIFVQVRAWTATPVSVNPHPIIGIIAFGLGLIQPIMAIFRPHPGTANRPIFNWAHRLVGFSAHILAIAAIFLGLMMPQMNVLGGRDYGAAFWIMVAYAAFHVLWLILLQLIDWIAPLVGGGRRTTTMQMKTVNGHGTVYEETVIQEPVKAPASTLKTILWFTHFIVVAGLTIAILVLIGIST